jgi:lipopolysaccharide/colanic/teichoic acid biosynthesis glycosyltransferase
MLTKRILDVIVAALGLIILAPVLLLIGLLIKLTSPGPVFFRQERVGLNAKVFAIHKFRTMTIDAPLRGLNLTVGKDKRITPIGRMLRKTKLDELPQLIDVLVGNMSLVGPRPEVPEFVTFYSPEVKQIVLSVRPGITEWASIRMIDENELLAKSTDPRQAYIKHILPEKLDFAVKYVQTRTFCQDCRIIFTTIIKLFTR